MKPGPRRVAWEILGGCEGPGPRLEKLIHLHLTRASHLDPRDKAFASALVYAVMRHKLRLQWLLNYLLAKPFSRLNSRLRRLLLIMAAELVVLGHPGHAAVSSAVDLARELGLGWASGLVNAVGRRLADGWEDIPLPSARQQPVEYLSVAYSHPRWIVELMLTHGDVGFVEQWLGANQLNPPFTLRVNTLRTTAQELMALFNTASIEAKAHPLLPTALVVNPPPGPASSLPGFKKGLWQAQDAGAQLLTLATAAAPGMRVLDMCAGAGGKSGQLWEMMRGQGELVAVEPSPGRARALRKNLARLGVTARIIEADALTLTPEKVGNFDLVLVDAPCTGLGVIGRRPDIRWRRTPADPPRMARLQRQLLAKALELSAPGGWVVYCTCTITPEENEEVVKALGGPGPWPEGCPAPATNCIDSRGYLRTYPHLHQADGFFGACIRK